MELVLSVFRSAQSDVSQCRKQENNEYAAPQAEFLPDDSEVKVILSFGKVEPLGARLTETYAPKASVGK